MLEETGQMDDIAVTLQKNEIDLQMLFVVTQTMHNRTERRWSRRAIQPNHVAGSI